MECGGSFWILGLHDGIPSLTPLSQTTDMIQNSDKLQNYQNIKIFYYTHYFQKSIFAFGGECELNIIK